MDDGSEAALGIIAPSERAAGTDVLPQVRPGEGRGNACAEGEDDREEEPPEEVGNKPFKARRRRVVHGA
jgi:hypothetical protein